MAANPMSYSLGKGVLYLAPFKPGTQIATEFRDIGNASEFTVTIETEKLDHFSSRGGLREKDMTVNLEVTRTLNVVTDSINADNLALFMMSDTGVETITTVGSTITDEPFNDIKVGRSYQLGVTESNPVGVAGINPTGFVVKNDAVSPTTYAAGTDYLLDPATGMFTVLGGGAITAGTNLRVTYSTLSRSRDQIKSGNKSAEGAMRFVTANPVGENVVYTFPYVSISPNGDLGLISEEWMQISLMGEILKRAGAEAIYRNGIPYTP